MSLQPSMPAPWLHVVVDMQRVFAEPGEWYAPGCSQVIEPIARLCARSGTDTAFTRFVTASTADAASGTWRGYYRRWHRVCLDQMGHDKLDVVAPLEAAARLGSVHDKTTHSAFNSGGFAQWLARSRYASLVLSGVETDVCVLATALDAVDRGIGVVVPSDAVTSSVEAAHVATLRHVLPRYGEQLVVASTRNVIEAWPT